MGTSDYPHIEAMQLDTTGDSPDVASQHTGSPDREGSPEHEGVSLPPVDTGRDAMLFLTACFIIECLVWGKQRAPEWKT